MESQWADGTAAEDLEYAHSDSSTDEGEMAMRCYAQTPSFAGTATLRMPCCRTS